ncbi:MAG: ABC transporter substrate-binding protein, partial [Chloroflexota bacterium]|nr:ABC transporter substrate-binding protein [Chloroflexota bacterium]
MSKKITRSQFLGTLGAVALGAVASPLLGACGGDDEADANGGPVTPSKVSDTTVKVGYLPITDSTPLTLGYAGGFFADQGLNADKPALFRGWSQLAEAFMADQVNVAHFLMPMTVWMRY